MKINQQLTQDLQRKRSMLASLFKDVKQENLDAVNAISSNMINATELKRKTMTPHQKDVALALALLEEFAMHFGAHMKTMVVKHYDESVEYASRIDREIRMTAGQYCMTMWSAVAPDSSAHFNDDKKPYLGSYRFDNSSTNAATVLAQLFITHLAKMDYKDKCLFHLLSKSVRKLVCTVLQVGGLTPIPMTLDDHRELLDLYTPWLDALDMSSPVNYYVACRHDTLKVSSDEVTAIRLAAPTAGDVVEFEKGTVIKAGEMALIAKRNTLRTEGPDWFSI